MDPSQGTHFFHNMTSAGIGYFSLAEVDEESRVCWEVLRGLPGVGSEPWLRHVALSRPLEIRMDGYTQRGLILLGGS